ncbi:DUF6248 family natural product biosynthesis protein [Actinoallomurus sp. CA-142502]|uniref:DUF6248 family natural product biosynthesis protein n=1 Tax=Actinoallomurus sp. CA-142502 TaxID=3239885 RepID=UPI003D8F41AD
MSDLMTPTEAAWVRENVWTPAYRDVHDAYTPGYFHLCACQRGICGACDGTSDKGRPRHDRCLSRQHGRPLVHPLAYLTDGRCMVSGPALWPADGPSCRYICPCPCAKTGPAPEPPSRLVPARDVAERSAPAPRRVPVPARGDDVLFDVTVST